MSRKIGFIITFVIMVLGGIVLYYLDPVQYRFMPKCLFKLVTGLDCPGCGFQRAVHALLHGHFVEAIKYNLFLAVGLPYLFAVTVAEIVLPAEKKWRAMLILQSKYMTLGYVALFTAWMIIRNILNI